MNIFQLNMNGYTVTVETTYIGFNSVNPYNRNEHGHGKHGNIYDVYIKNVVNVSRKAPLTLVNYLLACNRDEGYLSSLEIRHNYVNNTHKLVLNDDFEGVVRNVYKINQIIKLES